MYAQTRTRLTADDFRFIAQTLGRSDGDRAALLRLADDPESITRILHERKLFDCAMAVPPVFLPISPQLFFYVFIYQALDRKDLADDDLVDYVAGVCVEFRSSQALWQPSSSDEGKTVYIVDLLNLLPDVDKHQQYFLRKHIGNVVLFLTGFFPDFIFQRAKRKGAPPIQYYEQIGRSQFETAANDSHAVDEHAAPVLNTLADRFVEIRSALNVFTDARLHLNKNRSIEVVERQAATLDEQSFRQSLEA